MKTNKQSGRKGGVAPSSKAIKRPTRAKQVLSDEEFVEDLLDYFDGLSGFTFVANFFDRNPGYRMNYGPTLASAIDLLIRGRHGMDYLGPFPDPEIPVVALPALANERCPEIVKAVEARVQELRRRGIKFGLCWAAYGESPEVSPHLDWSGDFEDETDVCPELAEILKDTFDALLEL